MHHYGSWPTSSTGNKIQTVTDASHFYSRLPSSLRVHCNYRLKFFVKVHVRELETLFQNCSLNPWRHSLKALKGLSSQRVWQGACHESQCRDSVGTLPDPLPKYPCKNYVCGIVFIILVQTRFLVISQDTLLVHNPSSSLDK